MEVYQFNNNFNKYKILNQNLKIKEYILILQLFFKFTFLII